jgi:hypothetical protein
MRYTDIDKGEFIYLVWIFGLIILSFILAETIYYEIKERKQNSSNSKRGKKNL